MATTITGRLDRSTKLALVAMALRVSLTANDVTALSVAIPQIEKDIGTDLTTAQRVINGYALVLGVLIVTGEKLADLYGRRRIFIIGAAIFGVFSVLGGLAPSIEVVIGCRMVMGIGGAMVWPTVVGMTDGLLPEEKAGLAGGLIMGVAGFGNAVGPMLADLLLRLAVPPAVHDEAPQPLGPRGGRGPVADDGRVRGDVVHRGVALPAARREDDRVGRRRGSRRRDAPAVLPRRRHRLRGAGARDDRARHRGRALFLVDCDVRGHRARPVAVEPGRQRPLHVPDRGRCHRARDQHRDRRRVRDDRRRCGRRDQQRVQGRRPARGDRPRRRAAVRRGSVAHEAHHRLRSHRAHA
ncbi:MAG: MFS transporter [Actinobacteria bacterium]|nr:MFS transporter [Actinomycetota bacterium]